jgi:hypothetical protein
MALASGLSEPAALASVSEPTKEPDALASGQRPLNYKITKALRINPESFCVEIHCNNC